METEIIHNYKNFINSWKNLIEELINYSAFLILEDEIIFDDIKKNVNNISELFVKIKTLNLTKQNFENKIYFYKDLMQRCENTTKYLNFNIITTKIYFQNNQYFLNYLDELKLINDFMQSIIYENVHFKKIDSVIFSNEKKKI